MPIPRPSVEGILGEFRQQDYATVDGRLRTFVRTDRTLIRKTISLLQDRSDDDAVKPRRHEHAQPPPMDEGQTPNRSFRSARNVSRLIAVTRSLGTISSSRCQTTRACKRRVDATHCMREFVFTDEHLVAFAKALVSNSGSKFGLPTEAARPAKVGGARRNRTDDLLLAKQALSQLSYGPALRHQRSENGGPGKI